jgi:hypothetical protein
LRTGRARLIARTGQRPSPAPQRLLDKLARIEAKVARPDEQIDRGGNKLGVTVLLAGARGVSAGTPRVAVPERNRRDTID